MRGLGPAREGPQRSVRADALFGVVVRTVDVRRLQAVRLLAEELDRLDTERIAGLKVAGLGTEHLYGVRLPRSARWSELAELAAGAIRGALARRVGSTSPSPLRPRTKGANHSVRT